MNYGVIFQQPLMKVETAKLKLVRRIENNQVIDHKQLEQKIILGDYPPIEPFWLLVSLRWS